MVKILSQGGRSLADMYQAEGSIAGIDNLETRDLPIVHEMGATLFSERFRSTARQVRSGNLAQSTNIELEINNMPAAITRLVGIAVITDMVGRVSFVQVSLFDPITDQDFPIWAWDSTGIARTIRLRDNGATAVVNTLTAEPGNIFLPCFTGGEDQGALPQHQIRVRGATTAFGAGTVFVNVHLEVAFTFTGGVSAFGARVPSW